MSGDADARTGGRRIALLIEYDGTAYCGSQYQDNGPSIQSALEAAINNLTGETVRAAFAGRTDAGVHALGQTAAFDTESNLAASEFVRGLNHFLARDIAIRAARAVEPEFDPRRHARERLYRYRIENRVARLALERNRAWQVPRALDVAAMQAAAQRLEGAHDFAAFAAPYEGSTRRTLRRCAVSAHDGHIEIEMAAEAFLPHQVRRTVGPLVEVGLGKMTQEALVSLLQAAIPASAQPVAPALGLYLVSVKYDAFDFGRVEGDG